MIVMIQVRTFAVFAPYLPETLGVFYLIERPARLHALEHANQSFLHLMLGGELPSHFLFGYLARTQVAETLLFGLRHQRRLHDLRRHPGRISFELTAPNMIERQQGVHALRAYSCKAFL